MRWPWARHLEPVRLAAPPEPIDPMGFIDREVLESLEVIELDAQGRLMGPPRWPAADRIRELADRPGRSDPTGTAGIWEALSHG